MKIKSKTKKTLSKKTPASRIKKYQAHYLALILIVVLLLEGILIGSTSKLDWSNGAQILDMSGSVSELSHDMGTFFQPMADAYDAVNQFYAAAATQIMPLLDISQSVGDLAVLIDGVNEFYNQAATQMAYLLDASSAGSWPATVSGASISVSP